MRGVQSGNEYAEAYNLIRIQLMKILCIGYRDWAIKIYKNLENKLSEHKFIIIDSVSFYKEINIFQIKPDLILWYGWRTYKHRNY